MFISLLLRSTLLLLLADYSLAQEWYTQEDFGREYHWPGVPQDAQASFTEKRDASVMGSNVVHLTDYYAANVRQKRDMDDDDEESSNDVIDHAPSHVSSDDGYSLFETNTTNAENNETSDAVGWKLERDNDNESSSMLDDAEQSKIKEKPSSKHGSHASHIEESKKQGTEEIEETSEQADGSEKFPKERFLSDNEEDEQPVKRQNLGTKMQMSYYFR